MTKRMEAHDKWIRTIWLWPNLIQSTMNFWGDRLKSDTIRALQPQGTSRAFRYRNYEFEDADIFQSLVHGAQRHGVNCGTIFLEGPATSW